MEIRQFNSDPDLDGIKNSKFSFVTLLPNGRHRNPQSDTYFENTTHGWGCSKRIFVKFKLILQF